MRHRPDADARWCGHREAAAQLQSGCDLREVAPGIPNTVPEAEWEELAQEFYVAAEHATAATEVDDVLNHVARRG